MLTGRPVQDPAADRTTPDLDVLESSLWSESPLLEIDDGRQRRLVSHGEFITVAADACRPLPDGWPQPLVESSTSSSTTRPDRRTLAEVALVL